MRMQLLFPKRDDVKFLGEVKSPAVLSTDKTTFDPEGLYSTRIFGSVGSSERSEIFGYIDLKVEVVNPAIWKDLISLKALYEQIAQGKTYGRFDKATGDIVKSNMEEGETGYAWFIEQVPKLKLNDNKSDERNDKIRLIEKHKNNMMERYLYVSPAGMREYQLENNPSGEEHEIADLFRRVLNSKALIENINISLVDVKSIDAFRYRIQLAVVDIYDYIISLVDGKDKFILSAWTKRSMDFGVRSVISAVPLKVTNLKNVTDTINLTPAGLYVICKTISPKVLHQINVMFMDDIINETGNTVRVFKGGSFRTKNVEPKLIDKWRTYKGIESILSEMYSDEFKNNAVTIAGDPIVMVYEREDTVFVVTSQEDIPSDISTDELRPITYGELFYIAVLPISDEIYPLMTRYPIGSEGSIYPSKVKLMTTVPGRRILVSIGDVVLQADEYPTIGASWINIMSPNISRWSGLGSDNDGDKLSMHVPMFTTSIDENRKKFENPEFYIKPSGEPFFVLSNDVNERVVESIMSEV